MSVRWNDILQLPDAALAGGRRLTKTMLTEKAALTKHEQRTLDRVRRLEHFATATKGTTRMFPRVDEERDVQSIIFLRCEMVPGVQAVVEVARLLHKCFPNPTVILVEASELVGISVALMRKSHAERGATVVERVEGTGTFDPRDGRWLPFLNAMAYPALPQDDLQVYLEGIANAAMLARAIESLGFYPASAAADREQMLGLVGDFDAARVEVRRLYDERSAPDVTLNESAKLRMRIRKAEMRRDAVMNEIKELCHG